MFKKTMTFDDLDGNEKKQTFYFNFNKKEIVEMIGLKGLEEKIQRLQMPIEESGLTERENAQQAYDIFQELILDAYGEKGADNVTFVKNDQLREYFKSHVAFVELIFEFLENPTLGAQFIESCLPAKLVEKAKAEMALENGAKISSETLTEMVLEAERRQNDPATAIEPGDTSLIEPPVAPPEAPPAPKEQEDLTPEDIKTMPEDEFAKIDVRRLSRESMVAAFGRKNG